MSLTNFASIISRELSGFLADRLDIRKQIVIAIDKLDLFYIICLTLDFIGLIAVFLLLIKVKVPEQTAEIELVEFDSKELEAIEEDVEDMSCAELQDVPLD